MKDKNVDTHLRQHLSGDWPRDEFKQQALCNSTAEFIRVRRLRLAWYRAELVAAAILIAGLAFLGGRVSMPRTLPKGMDVPQLATDTPSGVNVSSELVAWLEAARLFRQLGMQDRMARAVERAGRLLPIDTFIADNHTLRVFATKSIRNQPDRVEPMGVSGPQPSAESIKQILAQSIGD